MRDILMKKIGIGLTILVLVIFISGCTSTPSLNQTFNSSGISFNYPSNWDKTDSGTETIFNGVKFQDLGSILSNDKKITVVVGKENLSDTPNITLQNVKNIVKQNIQNNQNVTYISENNSTVNNNQVFELVANVKDNKTGYVSKNLLVITGKQKQSAYFIGFATDPETFDKNVNLFNEMVSMIQLN